MLGARRDRLGTKRESRRASRKAIPGFLSIPGISIPGFSIPGFLAGFRKFCYHDAGMVEEIDS